MPGNLLVTVKQPIKLEIKKLSAADMLQSIYDPNHHRADAFARANHTGTQLSTTISDFSAAADARITLQKGAANGLATLGADSKIPTSQLPALAIADTFVVGSQAAMLALTAQRGDVAKRTDTQDVFILSTDDPTQLANWVLLSSDFQAAVDSVNGRVGVVTGLAEDNAVAHIAGDIGGTAAVPQVIATHLAAPLPAAQGGTGAGAFTQGSVLYVGASGVYAQDNANFFWDSTNKRMGIRTLFPQHSIDIAGGTIAVQMATPTGVSVSAASGGTMPAGTYYFKVTAVDGYGSTLGSSEVSVTLDGTTTNRATLNWTAVPGAYNYRIYKGTSAGAQDKWRETSAISGQVAPPTTFNYDSITGDNSGTVPTTNGAYVNKIAHNNTTYFLGQNVGIGKAPQGANYRLQVAGAVSVAGEIINGNSVLWADNDAHTLENGDGGWFRSRVGWGSGQGWQYRSGILDVNGDQGGQGEAYRVDGRGNFGIRTRGGNPAYGWDQYGGQMRVRQVATVGTPTVTPQGATGSTSYSYYVVAKDSIGNKTIASAPRTISNGNATLNSTNFNRITWTPVNGAVGYDILKTNTSTLLGSVASNSATPTQFDDTGQSTSAYTPAVRNTTADVLFDGAGTFGSTLNATGDITGGGKGIFTGTVSGAAPVLASEYVTKLYMELHNLEIFNVRNYGGIGDGSHDDTQAFKDCFAAAQAANGVAYSGTGRWRITSHINADYDLFTWLGAGMGKTVLVNDCGYGDAPFNLGNSSGPTARKKCVVDGMTFDLNAKSGSWGLVASWYADVYMSNLSFINPATNSFGVLLVGVFDQPNHNFPGQNINLTNILVDYGGVQSGWEAVTLDYAKNVNVVNFTGYNKPGPAPMLLSYGSEHQTWTNVFCVKAQISVGGRGTTHITHARLEDCNILIWDGDDVIVTSSAFIGHDTAYATGITIQSDYMEVGGLENPFYVTAPYAWHARNITINGNIFDHANAFAVNATRTISPVTSTHNLSVQNLIFTNNQLHDSNWDGAVMVAEYLNFSNNMSYNNGQAGASTVKENFTLAAKEGIFVGNMSFDNQGTPTANKDLVIQNGYTDVIPTQSWTISENKMLAGGIFFSDGVSPIFASPKPSNITINGTNNKGVNPNAAYAQGNITGATTFDRKNGRIINATLTGNVTATVPFTLFDSEELILSLTQDGTGGRTISWPGNVIFPGGTAEPINTTAGAKTTYRFMFDGTNWICVSGLTKAQLDALYEPFITAGTTAQYRRGDKTWQTLDKTAVGLSNVPNVDATARANHTGTQSADTLTDGTTNKAFLATERTKLAGIATGATANQTDAFLLARANHTGTQLASTISDFSTAADARITAQKAAANGLATLDSGGLIPTNQLPALAITSTQVAASQAAQLALTTQEGDVVVRTDQNKSYIRLSTSLGTMADYQELLTPTDTVLSVNGFTGAVTLTTSNITEGSNLYYTDARVAAAPGVTNKLPLAGGTMTGSFQLNLENSYFGIDAQALPRLGFQKKSGLNPAIVAASGVDMVFYQSNQSDIATSISGATLTEIARFKNTGPVFPLTTQMATGYVTGNLGLGVAVPGQRLHAASGSKFQIEMPAPSGGTATPIVGVGGANLVAGTQYFYKLVSSDATGGSLPSAAFSATPDATNGQIRIDWTTTPGSYATDIYRGTSAGSVGYIGSAFGTNVTYTDTGANASGSAPPSTQGAFSVKLDPTGSSWILGTGAVQLGKASPGTAGYTLKAGDAISAGNNGANGTAFSDGDAHSWEAFAGGWWRLRSGWGNGQGFSFYAGVNSNVVEIMRMTGGGQLLIGHSTYNNSFLDVRGSISNLGGQLTNALATPAQPTVANIGTAGSTSYTYVITAKSATGETVGSTSRVTTTGNATLDSTNKNRITWTAVPGAASYNIYRTASSGTPSSTGLIGNVGYSVTLTFDDTGIAGGVALPTVDTSTNSGVGLTTPTARLHLGAGSAQAGTAPLKINSGTVMTTPENGAIENDGTHLYVTLGGARLQLDYESVIDGKNIAVGTGTGTKIGTATNQKLGFFNSTPIIQPSGAAEAAVATTGATNTTPYGFTTAAQADGIITLLNEIRTVLVNLGFMKGSA